MSEHLPGSMIGEEILAWCEVCERETKHRVDPVSIDFHAGKIGPCLEDHVAWLTKRQEKIRRQLADEQRQPSLFPNLRAGSRKRI